MSRRRAVISEDDVEEMQDAFASNAEVKMTPASTVTSETQFQLPPRRRLTRPSYKEVSDEDEVEEVALAPKKKSGGASKKPYSEEDEEDDEDEDEEEDEVEFGASSNKRRPSSSAPNRSSSRAAVTASKSASVNPFEAFRFPGKQATSGEKAKVPITQLIQLGASKHPAKAPNSFVSSRPTRNNAVPVSSSRNKGKTNGKSHTEVDEDDNEDEEDHEESDEDSKPRSRGRSRKVAKEEVSGSMRRSSRSAVVNSHINYKLPDFEFDHEEDEEVDGGNEYNQKKKPLSTSSKKQKDNSDNDEEEDEDEDDDEESDEDNEPDSDEEEEEDSEEEEVSKRKQPLRRNASASSASNSKRVMPAIRPQSKPKRKIANSDDDDDDESSEEEEENSDAPPSEEDDGDENCEPERVIEKLLAKKPMSRASGPKAGQVEDHFLIKFKDISYLHVQWIPQHDLIHNFEGGKQRVQRFLTKEAADELEIDYGSGEFFNPDYLEVERIISHQELDSDDENSDDEEDVGPSASQSSLSQHRSVFEAFQLPDASSSSTSAVSLSKNSAIVLDQESEDEEYSSSSSPSSAKHAAESKKQSLYDPKMKPDDSSATYRQYQFLVKWKSLPYSESTWERFSSIKTAVDKIEQYFIRNKYPSDTGRFVGTARGRVRPPQYTETLIYKNDNQLRSYQLEGLNWLAFNYSEARNVILADEMGLGKTVQCVTFLNWLNTCQNVRGPFLVIAPLSTLPHWQREFEAWTDMNALLYHGDAASRDLIFEHEFNYFNERTGTRIKRPYKFHALLTSPEMAMQDVEVLSFIKWEVLICDEAQRLKNRNSKFFQSLELIDFCHTVLLSGTPLQNSVEELWSLLFFLDKENFGDRDDFMAKYGSMKDSARVKQLQEEIRPYMLRRLKGDVEKSLPGKEETLVEVELTHLQKKFYKAVYEKNSAVLSQMANGNSSLIGKTTVSLMNIAMQLRKTCNHPFTLEGVEEAELRSCHTRQEAFERLVSASGKLVLLDKLLPRLREQGHKVLLFSQMVKVLDIVEDYASFRGFGYERIDGSIKSTDRQQAIDRFSKPDSDKFLFLLCTRAGGVGINLTAADTVVIFDSDWNPQNDLQATARCHRIGQKKEVKIYRLITRNTYEQTMFTKASMKLGLDRAVLQSMALVASDGAASSSAKPQLSNKEIETLLREGAYAIFTEENDKAVEQFQADDIDKILSRSTTIVHKDDTDGNGEGGKSSFSKAAFVAHKRDSEISMDDPEFWTKIGVHRAPTINIQEEFFAASRSRHSLAKLGSLSESKLSRLQKIGVDSDDAESGDDHTDDSDASGAEDEEDGSAHRGHPSSKLKKQKLAKMDDSISAASSKWTTKHRDIVLHQLSVRGYGAWADIQHCLTQFDRAKAAGFSEERLAFLYDHNVKPADGDEDMLKSLSSSSTLPVTYSVMDIESLVLSFIAEVVRAIGSELQLRCLVNSIRSDVIEVLVDRELSAISAEVASSSSADSSSSSSSSPVGASPQRSTRILTKSSRRLEEARAKFDKEVSSFALLKQIPVDPCLVTERAKSFVEEQGKVVLQDIERIRAVQACLEFERQTLAASSSSVIDVTAMEHDNSSSASASSSPSSTPVLSEATLLQSLVDECASEYKPTDKWEDEDDRHALLGIAKYGLQFDKIAVDPGLRFDASEWRFPAASNMKRRFISLAAIALRDWRKRLGVNEGAVSSGEKRKKKVAAEDIPDTLSNKDKKNIEKSLQMVYVNLDDNDISSSSSSSSSPTLIDSWPLFVRLSECSHKSPAAIKAYIKSCLEWCCQLETKSTNTADPSSVVAISSVQVAKKIIDRQRMLKTLTEFGLVSEESGTKLARLLFRPFSGGPSDWFTGRHDRALLNAILKYGFGNWKDSLQDPDCSSLNELKCALSLMDPNKEKSHVFPKEKAIEARLIQIISVLPQLPHLDMNAPFRPLANLKSKKPKPIQSERADGGDDFEDQPLSKKYKPTANPFSSAASPVSVPASAFSSSPSPSSATDTVQASSPSSSSDMVCDLQQPLTSSSSSPDTVPDTNKAETNDVEKPRTSSAVPPVKKQSNLLLTSFFKKS